MKKIFISSFLLTLTFVTACKRDFFEAPPPLDLATPVSFSLDIMPIFKANCYGSGCHNTGTVPDLSEGNAYDQLTQLGYVDTTNAEGSKIYIRITDANKPMPPGGTMPGEETNKILAWIKQGAKND
jgi:hypothetical protein